MGTVSTSERVSRLEQLDPSVACVADVATGLTDIRLVRGWLDMREAELARRQNDLAETVGAAPAADVIGRSTKTSRRTAERVAARSEALADSPALSERLADGSISADHADVFASVTERLDVPVITELRDRDDEVAQAAVQRTPEQFRRHLNALARELSDDDGVEESERQRERARVHLELDEKTGMGELRGELHPDDYQKVKRRIDAEVNALRQHPQHETARRDQLAALALVNLVTGVRATSRVPAEVSIHVPLATINGVDGAPRFGEYLDGSPVPVETVRRHACDANIIPIVLGGDGVPLDVGRARRLATPGQRTALRAMYRSCAVGDCPTAFDRCEIHHVLEWTADQGPTDLRYLFPACGYHHHRLHEGRWQAQLDPSTRQLTIHYPDGTLHSRSLPDLLGPDVEAA